MNRKFVEGLVISFFILFILVIIGLFVKLPGYYAIYTLFIFELFFLTWKTTRKISIKSPLRTLIGTAIILFFPLLTLTILGLIFNLGFIERIVYFIFAIDFLFLLILFLRRQIRNYLAKRARREIEPETLFERITKYVVYLIPVVIFGYVLWMNFNPFTETIVYDIGSEDDKGILVPEERVSEPMKKGDVTYREIKHNAVYFDISDFKPGYLPDKIKIKVKFKDNFPERYSFSIGARTKDDSDMGWHYEYKDLFIKDYKDKKMYSPNNYPKDFPENSTIYIDPNLNITLNNPKTELKDYQPKKLIIDNSLRGAHTILIYVKGDLNFQVFKQDLNWYDGKDELKIDLYKNNNLIKSVIIPDDGITDNSHKISNIQNGMLSAKNLKEGIYRIKLNCNDDTIIKKIISNQNKLIFENNIFLAGTTYFENDKNKFQLYFENNANQDIEFFIIREESFQDLLLNSKIIKINKTTWVKEKIKVGKYFLKSEGDVIIKSNNYFAFSKDSYFIPYNFFIIEDSSNAQYIISDYKEPNKQNDWSIAEIEFNLDELYIRKDKLNFVFNIPHLFKENLKKYTIPIDNIKIEIIK